MDARALAALVERSHPGASVAVRDALVGEKLDALTDPDAGRVHAIDADGCVAAAVEPPGGARAWLLGISGRTPGDARALDALCDALERAGVRSVLAAGPPGSYLCSGVAADDAGALAWFAARGFAPRSRHVDLVARLASPGVRDARVRRARGDEAQAIRAWIAREFAPAWAREAARAHAAHDALFVADAAERGAEAGAPWLGFAAHSGNNAALGTFGPVGVDARARRAGLGTALARAALDELASRGFTAATIPWVDPARVAFYGPLVASLEVRPRVVLARALGP